MKFMMNIAVAGVLLAATPAYAATDTANDKSAAKAEHGEGHHGRKYGGQGRDHGAMMGGHRMMRGHGAMMGGHGMMRGHGKMGGRGLMSTFDTDGDGRLTQSEIDKSRGDRLTKFDGDGNGSLNLSEYQSLWLAAMRERMVDRFQDLDADGDAVVTAEEFKRPFADLVRRLDRNGDGALTREHKMKGKKKKE